MHAIYHCVPAKTLKPTDDLNVREKYLDFIPLDWDLRLEEKGYGEGGQERVYFWGREPKLEG